MNNIQNKYFKKIGTGSWVILVTCFFYTCEGTYDNPPLETIPPVVNIYDPDSNGFLTNGDTIHFTGNVSDNYQLQSLQLTVEGLQGQLYYTYNPVIGGLTAFSFNTPWLVNGIPYDTIGYMNLLVADVNGTYTYKHWYMRLRN